MYREYLYTITDFVSRTQCRIGTIICFSISLLVEIFTDQHIIMTVQPFLLGFGLFILSFECKDSKEE